MVGRVGHKLVIKQQQPRMRVGQNKNIGAGRQRMECVNTLKLAQVTRQRKTPERSPRAYITPQQWFSKWDLGTSSIGHTWKPVRHVSLESHPRSTESGARRLGATKCVLTRLPMIAILTEAR